MKNCDIIKVDEKNECIKILTNSSIYSVLLELSSVNSVLIENKLINIIKIFFADNMINGYLNILIDRDN